MNPQPLLIFVTALLIVTVALLVIGIVFSLRTLHAIGPWPWRIRSLEKQMEELVRSHAALAGRHAVLKAQVRELQKNTPCVEVETGLYDPPPWMTGGRDEFTDETDKE